MTATIAIGLVSIGIAFDLIAAVRVLVTARTGRARSALPLVGFVFYVSAITYYCVHNGHWVWGSVGYVLALVVHVAFLIVPAVLIRRYTTPRAS